MNLKDLIVVVEYRDALRGLSETEFSTLEKNILADGFLDPIKFHYDSEGRPCIVDGMHRYKVWQGLPAGCPHVPNVQEVTTLNGANTEQVVDWIQRTQFGRRNEDTLQKWYSIGKRFNDGESPGDLSTECEVSIASIHKYGAFASKIDAIEYESPGIKTQVLNSGKSVLSVTEAIKENRVEGLLRDEPRAPKPRNYFKIAKAHLTKLTKAVDQIVLPQNHGSHPMGDSCIGFCAQIRDTLNNWELLEIGATDVKEEEDT